MLRSPCALNWEGARILVQESSGVISMKDESTGRQWKYMGYLYNASAESEDGESWSGSVVVAERCGERIGMKRFAVEGAFESSGMALGAAEMLARQIINREIPGIEDLWPNGKPRILDH
jgi:hypothetical protein